jgi:hypothetical protein
VAAAAARVLAQLPVQPLSDYGCLPGVCGAAVSRGPHAHQVAWPGSACVVPGGLFTCKPCDHRSSLPTGCTPNHAHTQARSRASPTCRRVLSWQPGSWRSRSHSGVLAQTGPQLALHPATRVLRLVLQLAPAAKAATAAAPLMLMLCQPASHCGCCPLCQALLRQQD